MRYARSLLSAIAMSVAALAAGHSLAAVSNVSPSPATASIAVNQSAAVTITWRVQQMESTPQTIVSSVGTLILNGSPVATVNRTFSRAVPAAVPNVVLFTETLSIPRSLVYQVVKTGASGLQYQRVFQDLGGSATGLATLVVTGSGSASFAISRIELSFVEKPDSKIVIAEEGATLHPVARVRFAGSGMLSAEWKVADANSAPGQQIFVSRRIVRRYLSAGGEVEIVGPALPTSSTGQYDVIFEVNTIDTTPDDLGRIEFEAPRVTYYVRAPSPDEAQRPLARILMTAPAAHALLADDARVSWSAVEQAAVYQLVFYAANALPLTEPEARAAYGQEAPPPERAPGEVVAGFYVKAEEGTSAAVPQTSLSHLEAGQPYFLQVIARDSRGILLGQSEPREIWR